MSGRRKKGKIRSNRLKQTKKHKRNRTSEKHDHVGRSGQTIMGSAKEEWQEKKA